MRRWLLAIVVLAAGACSGCSFVYQDKLYVCETEQYLVTCDVADVW